jgi:flagellar hook-basal body complex protein FliE
MDVVSFKSFDFAQAAAKAGLRTEGNRVLSPGRATPEVGGSSSVQGGSFASAISQALKEVSASQLESSRLQREVQLDNPTVSLEQTMVAMQKAQLGFTAAVQVRNRLVQAYTDIMNMQV